MKARARQSGFTLLEVLIAAVLIGSVFVAVVSLMSQSLRNIDRMKPHEVAILHAREVMNRQLLSGELQPGSMAGQWPDGYQWHGDIAALDFVAIGKTTRQPEPVPPPSSNSTASIAPGMNTLFQVKVRVTWGDRDNARNYELQTMQWAKWRLPQQP